MPHFSQSARASKEKDDGGNYAPYILRTFAASDEGVFTEPRKDGLLSSCL